MTDFTITVSDTGAVIQWLTAMPGALSDALGVQSEAIGQQMAQEVADEKLSGQVLQTRTGKLRDGVESSVATADAVVAGSVSVTGVAYAAIQEFGGTTKAHIIEAVNAKALAFAFQGKQSFFRRIQHPGSVIPERSFLRSSLEDSTDRIMSGFKQALANVTGD